MSITYTENQKKAIQHVEGNLLIIACAGSGKTEIISRKIAERVKGGLNKGSIIAFTFTEKAAAELKTRIRLHLEELIPDDPALGDMYVGTIHSFCLELLKEIDPKYRNFEVIDEEQRVAYIDSNYFNLELNKFRDRFNINWSETIEGFVETLNLLYLENKKLNDLPDEDIRESVRLYYESIGDKPRYFFDFNMIIGELIDVLSEDERVREMIQDKFKLVVVDEYQDIDPRQEELIGLLHGPNTYLCVVGDDDQAIFGWRGADIDNILTFVERYENVEVIDLVNNFRSTHAITEIANRAVRIIPQRLEKAMDAVHWEDASGELEETMAEQGDIHRISFETEEEEAFYIADRIQYLRGVKFEEKNGTTRGLDFGDMAVLFRSVRNYAAPLVDELRRRGIPFIVKGARGLFDHNEIHLIQAVFCLLAGTELFRSIGFRDWEKLNEDEIRNRVRTLIEEVRRDFGLPIDDNKLFEWIAKTKAELDLAALDREERPRNISRRIFPQKMFHEMLEVMGITEGEWDESVLYNVGRFSTLVTKYESVHQWIEPKNLVDFARFLSTWAFFRVEEGSPDEFNALNAVNITTIHQAKGLEWPVVFIPSISSYHFPSPRRNERKKTLVDGFFDLDKYVTGDDGERRLWYVAVTRSKKFLNITAIDRTRKRPQDYFKEIEHNYVIDRNEDPSERERLEPRLPIELDLIPTTYSDLNYFWHCPYDYKLRKLMGFGPTIDQVFGYGQQIHNLLTSIHKRAKERDYVNRDDLTGLIEENLNLRYTTGEPLERMKNAALVTLNNYYDFLGDDLVGLVLDAEKPFEFVLGEALVSGTIDLLERIDESSGEIIPVGVVDFKTGIDSDEENFQRRVEDSNRQIILYAIAAREALRLNPRKAEIHFLDTKEQRRITVDIAEGSREKLQECFDTAIRDIRNKDLPRAPANGVDQCTRCDFAKLCPGCE